MESSQPGSKRNREEYSQDLEVEQNIPAKRKATDELSAHAEVALAQVQQYVENELPEEFTPQQKERLIELCHSVIFHRASYKQIQHRNFVYTQVESKYSLPPFTFSYTCSSQSGDDRVYDIVAQFTVEKNHEGGSSGSAPTVLLHVNVGDNSEAESNDSAVFKEADFEVVLASLGLDPHIPGSALYCMNFLLCFVEPNSIGYASSLQVADLIFGLSSTSSESVSYAEESAAICDDVTSYAEQTDEAPPEVPAAMEASGEPSAQAASRDADVHEEFDEAMDQDQAEANVGPSEAEPETKDAELSEIDPEPESQQQQQLEDSRISADVDYDENIDPEANDTADVAVEEDPNEKYVDDETQAANGSLDGEYCEGEEQYEVDQGAEEQIEDTDEQEHNEEEYATDGAYVQDTSLGDENEEDDEPITQVYEAQDNEGIPEPSDVAHDETCDEEPSDYYDGDGDEFQETNNPNNEEYLEKGDLDQGCSDTNVEVDFEVPDDSEHN